MMLITFVGWTRARKAQNLKNEDLYYVAPWNPYHSYFALLLGCIALIFIGFNKFAPFDTQGFITSYFCLPYMFVLFFSWKLIKRTKWVNPATADLVSGKAECDRECQQWEEGGIEENWKRELAQMSFARRCWERIW
jgi:yeast amino acid transporter